MNWNRIWVMSLSLLGFVAQADTYGLVSKRVDDVSFIEVWRGCDAAAKENGDHCRLLGAKGSAHPRLQIKAIEKALQSHQYKALAIAVTKSDFIANVVQDADIPIITFDSPFDVNEKSASLSYIGVDNVGIGRKLAKLVLRLRPEGGKICFMTAAYDKNLTERLLGIRQGLSGVELKEGVRLTGQNGWTEHQRCPWDTGDNLKRSREQVALTLQSLDADVIATVGHWPIVNTAGYKESVLPFRDELSKHKKVIVGVVGGMSEAYQNLLDKKLLHGLVAVDFYGTGRECYRQMKAAANGETIPREVYVDSLVFTDSEN
jgi:ribose transport system substrate-binding protein